MAESWLQLRQPVIEPRGESKADTWIVFELAKLLGLAEHFWGGDPEAGMQALLDPSGIDIETLKASPEGINLQLTTRYQKYRQDGFATPTGLYEIYSEAFLQAGYAPVPCFQDDELAEEDEFPLLLTSAKQAAHCHSQHKDLASLNRRMKGPEIEINTELANTLGVADGEEFTVETQLGQLRGVAKLNPDLAKGVLCAQYGWQLAMQNYNAIASELGSDPISGSNPLKRQACRIVLPDAC